MTMDELKSGDVTRGGDGCKEHPDLSRHVPQYGNIERKGIERDKLRSWQREGEDGGG